MTFLDGALLFLGLGFLAGWARASLGPTIADRAVAADVCFYVVVAALALLAVRLRASVFVDAVLVASLLGFVATLALAWLVWGRRA